MEKSKKKQQPVVSKPYIRGKAFDSKTVGTAVKFFLAMVGVSLMFLLVATMIASSITVLNIIFNSALLIGVMIIFINNGASRAVGTVVQGEVLYNRQESGRALDQNDATGGFHPAKGFVIGLLGTAPLFIIACILAFGAQRQMTGMGSLPTWISSYTNRPEINNALQPYFVSEPVSVMSVARIVVRMYLMPVVSMIGATNYDGLLLMERLSPVLALLPALGYGYGYTRGPALRANVHTAIDASKRKRARREKRERRSRIASMKREPKQLN